MRPHSHPHQPKHDVEHVVSKKEERWCWYLQAGKWTVFERRQHSCSRSASLSHLSQQQHCCWSKMLTVVSAMAAANAETAVEDSTGYHHWPLLAMEHSSDVACYAYYQPSPSRVDSVLLFEAISNRNLANARSENDLTTPWAWYGTSLESVTMTRSMGGDDVSIKQTPLAYANKDHDDSLACLRISRYHLCSTDLLENLE